MSIVKKTNQKPKKHHQIVRRRPIIVILVILSIALITLVIAKLMVNHAAEEVDEEITTDNTTTEQIEETGALGATDADPGQTPQQYDGPNANTYDYYSGAITYTNVADGTLAIRVNIDQTINSGTCALEMKNGAHTYTETVPATIDVTTSTCQGFDIPVDKLASGTWDIKITVSNGQKTGTISGSTNL